MAIVVNLKKLLSILALIIIFVLMAPDIANGTPGQLDLPQLLKQENFTPQEHQELQAVRQRRNREITAVLKPSQRHRLEHLLRHGHDLEDAINTLDINHEQWDTIQAIMELSAFKTKAILNRHPQPTPS